MITVEQFRRDTKLAKVEVKHVTHLSNPNLSSPKPGHTTGGSVRRGAQADGGAGPCWAEQGTDISDGPEGNCPSSPPGYHSRTCLA